MLCRVAENLFWMGRYVERAMARVRLVDVTAHLELDAGEGDERQGAFWEPLLYSGRGDGLDPWAQKIGGEPTASMLSARQFLAFDATNPGSLVSCIRLARSAAREVRESLSSEMWEHLNTLYLVLADRSVIEEALEQPHAFYKRIHEALLLFQGLTDSTLAHDQGWQFITLGTYLERADNVAGALNLQAHLLQPSRGATRLGDDVVRWLAVLRSCGAAEAYAHFYSLRIEPPRVIEFLLLNPLFPRSVRYSLQVAQSVLREVAQQGSFASVTSEPPIRALGRLAARVEHASVDEVLEEGLRPCLNLVQDDIASVSDEITRGYFRREMPEIRPHSQMAVARAAQIMAAQQQQ